VSFKIAGIGSRSTPTNILHTMQRIGLWCCDNSIIVRSGHAEGADQAFEAAGRFLEVYLPWKGFNCDFPIPISAHQKVWEYVPARDDNWLALHPSPKSLKPSVRALMGRNAMQVLGPDHNDPVNVVVCWTPGGKEVGGTSHAMRIARTVGVPIINLAGCTEAEAFRDLGVLLGLYNDSLEK